jgi:Flp pilus assembly pilin Flp
VETRSLDDRNGSRNGHMGITGDPGPISGEVSEMDLITKGYVKVKEYQRGQTMTEYALILAAIAVVALAAYTTMGSKISSMVNTLNTDL